LDKIDEPKIHAMHSELSKAEAADVLIATRSSQAAWQSLVRVVRPTG